MSFFDDASLAFLPSGAAGKDGKAYSIKPTDGTGDFTFSRGSNLAATRVGADGLIEKGRENLFFQSNQFDTTWAKSSLSLTSGQSGYDGSSDAWLVDISASSANLRQTINTSGVNSFSVYAKEGSLGWLRMNNNVALSYFDLASLTIGTTSGTGFIDSSITSIGNGWVRCTLVFNGDGVTHRFYPADTDNSLPTSGTIYIQDAQLEIGLAATDYIETRAITGKAGLLEDEPRFDYSGGATCPSLLLEPSRTNLVQFSEYFGGTGWSLDGGVQSVTSNYSISPEGVKNAARLQLDRTGTAYSRLYVDAGSIGEATISVYMKSNTSQTQNVGLRYDGTGVNCEVTTEWERFDLTATSTAVSRFQILLFNSIAGNDETADISIYGAQFEQASYPTSYIPNHSGGSVTRGDDLGTNTDITDELPSSGYTIFFELKSPKVLSGIQGPLNFLGVVSDRITPYFFNGNLVSDFIASGTTNGGLILQSSVSVDTTYKVGISVDTNNIRKSVNGAAASLLTADLVIPVLINMKLGNGTSSNALGSTIQSVILFPEVLSDADLATLTTL